MLNLNAIVLNYSAIVLNLNAIVLNLNAIVLKVYVLQGKMSRPTLNSDKICFPSLAEYHQSERTHAK